MGGEQQPAKIKVLTFMNYYVPGFKGGGAFRTLLNMIDVLGDEFEFHVVTRDRDAGETQPYDSVEIDAWQQVGKARVLYLSPARMSLGSLRELMRTMDHDLVYCLGFHDADFTQKPLLLHRLGLVPKKPVIVAPQNELSPGALSLKKTKKRAYQIAARVLGLYRDVTFHASNELEREEIAAVFGQSNPIVVARNLQGVAPPEIDETRRPPKTPGSLWVAFLSRICTKKNLDGALRILANPALSGEITFDVYGPIEDPDYWQECQELIRALPSNIRVTHRGSVENADVLPTLSRYHLFLFPTLGESFGYVILESLLGGCPVLISDQTPWTNLEEGKAGWCLPLSEPGRFGDAIQKCVQMSAEEHAEWSKGARDRARVYADDPGPRDETRRLLLDAAARTV
jgi:glycosyltransferase involved in cell wall biosynthesis